MDREAVLQLLAEAEQHVALGAKHIAHQQKLIEELERGQHDLTEAKALLAHFEELQTLHVMHRDRLRTT